MGSKGLSALGGSGQSPGLPSFTELSHPPAGFMWNPHHPRDMIEFLGA